jgi:hypothetical protein
MKTHAISGPAFAALLLVALLMRLELPLIMVQM